jgi:hypothetical protein
MERLVKIALAVAMVAFCTLILVMCVAGVFALAKWMMGM